MYYCIDKSFINNKFKLFLKKKKIISNKKFIYIYILIYKY